MKKILVKGNSDNAVKEVRSHIADYGALKHVAVYFENFNFLQSDYKLLSSWVHLILECENAEIQIENANCGYAGAGPRATEVILTAFGMERDEVDWLVESCSALDFYVVSNKAVYINTHEIFCADIGIDKLRRFDMNKIYHSPNVQIDLDRKKALFYNPQRHDFVGFLRLLNCMKKRKFEYYIGSNSPLEEGLSVGEEFEQNAMKNSIDMDLKGVDHVNLVVSGENFCVACMIDREEELQTIDAIYYALAGEHLFDEMRRSPIASGCSLLKAMLWKYKHVNDELSDILLLPDLQ